MAGPASAGTAGYNTEQGTPGGRRLPVGRGARGGKGSRVVRGGASSSLPACAPPSSAAPRALTDEEDGESDEEQEDVRHHVERVHEATVVEDALVHPVGGRVVLAAAEGQGHGGAGAGAGAGAVWGSGSGSDTGSGCGWLHAPPAPLSLAAWRSDPAVRPPPHPRGPRPAGAPAPPHPASRHYLRGRGAARSLSGRAFQLWWPARPDVLGTL